MEYIENVDVNNKKVILRLDLNVTIKDSKIIDDTKIRKSIPTIKYLLDHNANILIMSHLGKVKSEEDKASASLELVANSLNSLLGQEINFIRNTRSKELEEATKKYRVSLMENTRFEDIPNKYESNCDDNLAKYWSTLGEIFINDAFGTTHRKHASNYGISKFLPSAYGFLINEELNGLEPIIKNIKKPFTVIMGGAKVDDKVALIESLLNECDYLLVGGGIANTFLKALGYNVGKSLYSAEYVDKIKELTNTYKEKILIPIDVVVQKQDDIKCFNVEDVADDSIIYDIGKNTIDLYQNILSKSKTIFVNGTMGFYENEAFKNGTDNLYKALNKTDAITIAGGGDAVASINKLGYASNFDFLSTGGGATLEYIAEKKINCFGEE